MKKFLAALLLLPLTPASAQPVADGKTFWEGPAVSCRNCHGKLGEGGLGPDLAGRGLSTPQFQQAIRHPWGVMPTFTEAQISDAEIASLATYFAGLPKNAQPAAWRVPVDPAGARGKQMLASAGCAQCHGATFDMARSALGGTNADFALFKDLVYKHTDVIGPFDESMRDGPPPAPVPGRPPRRSQMGNFNPLRVSEEQLKVIYDWAHDDVGFRPALQARLTPPAAGAATYTLNLSNGGIKGKGLTASGVIIDFVVPTGTTVVSATGDGYKGVHADAGGSVAEWQVARLAPKDAQAFTITLSAAAKPDDVKGTIRWAKPMPKSGPNMDVVNFALPRPPGP